MSGIFKLTEQIQYKKNVMNPNLREADKFPVNKPVCAHTFFSVRLK